MKTDFRQQLQNVHTQRDTQRNKRECSAKYTHLTTNRATFAENCLFLRLDGPYLAKVIGNGEKGDRFKTMGMGMRMRVNEPIVYKIL